MDFEEYSKEFTECDYPINDEVKEPDSLSKNLSIANIAISVDAYDNLHILKNRYGSNTTLDKREANLLISKIVSNTILGQKTILKFFKASLEQEIVDSCEKIFRRWGITF